ncbi:MAG: fasciclin domain-containing protein, partial [Chitinophagales bacterium]
LVAALTKANLAGTLAGDGPFTVFAPTNDAFAALLSDLGVSSLDELSAEQLTPILLYHVVSGDVRSGALSNGYVPTLSDGPNSTKVSLLVNTDSGVSLNTSTTVTTADVEANNGVIHIIDKVLLPPSVVSTAINNPAFSTLVAAVVKANLVDALSSTGPFTVFAPTNDAFDQLLVDLSVTSLDDLTAADLLPILQYHVVSGNNVSTGLSSGTVPTLNTEASLSIDVSNGVVINGDVNVIIADVQSTNGVVHAIDKVLVPAK